MFLPLPILAYLFSFFEPRPNPQVSPQIWAKKIESCPPLSARSLPPLAVWDLRPDDFSYTMALGDSITAGWFLGGIRETEEQTMHEYRGSSYAAGGDEEAITIPNMIRHYNPNLTGFSLGEHGAEICFGALCPVGPIGWNPSQDQLNAALSGSLAVNLPHQARDYLVPQAWRTGVEREKWKFLNLQIGSNDLCSLCTAPEMFGFGPGSPDLFELSVREALEIVREGIPNTLVNVVGVFDVSSLYNLTQNGRDPYCSKSIPLHGFECSCSLRDGELGDITRRRMQRLATQYNERLVSIVKSYQARADPTFSLTYQPPSILDLSAQPIEALSRADCFHPSLAAHQRLARGIWNRLTRSQEEKSLGIDWDGRDAREVRCLTGGERIGVSGV
ncbi:hypothetical protein BDY24DRAFT_395118 [Mrakia frigida]|uniref:uncharacterized protein n=1 Tax=Mrakia frigida TaxID=29902 RepID=UPI003FCBF6CC